MRTMHFETIIQDFYHMKRQFSGGMNINNDLNATQLKKKFVLNCYFIFVKILCLIHLVYILFSGEKYG